LGQKTHWNLNPQLQAPFAKAAFQRANRICEIASLALFSESTMRMKLRRWLCIWVGTFLVDYAGQQMKTPLNAKTAGTSPKTLQSASVNQPNLMRRFRRK